ncbi:spore germination protein [Paenibacillus paeoniae]|uniref:spore germination protein n=1 Tax=Paenibacillus paeoniae TaxID=2292705 RepID=UPI00140271FF|nr:spore germination protein [Paenibacillus paeoniae]
MDVRNDQSLSDLELQIITPFEHSSDFVYKSVFIGRERFMAYYLESLVDLSKTLSVMNTADGVMEQGDSAIVITDISKAILQGKLILFNAEGLMGITDAESPDISRQITLPASENPLQSAFDSYTEDIDKNIGLLRKKIVTSKLVIEHKTTGTEVSKKLAIMYLHGIAPDKVVQAIRTKLEKNSHKEITTVRDLLAILGHPKFALTPTYLSSELPGDTVQNLRDGKVIILIDQFSFAFAFPTVIRDLWASKLDENYPYLFQLFIRSIRAVGTLFALTLPGLYIVLNSVNPELLRIQLAIAVAKSREGIPYPSLIELLLVMLLLEMIIEATIRLPKNIGPTITMIGGILLGQAIVQAKLVSNLLIIILVASAIANFVLSGYLNMIGIRLYKYVVIFASSFFGIWGLEAAMIWLIYYFASLQIHTVPYLSLSVKGKSLDE